MTDKKAWRYHKELGSKIFEGQALEDAEAEGWVDSPAKFDSEKGGDSTSNPPPVNEGGAVDYRDTKQWTKKLLKIECNNKNIDFSHLGTKPKNDELIALLEG